MHYKKNVPAIHRYILNDYTLFQLAMSQIITLHTF